MLQRGDGTFEYRDRKRGFVATVHKDGRVTFRDVVITAPKIEIAGGSVRTLQPRGARDDLASNTLVRPQDFASLGDDGLVKNGPYGPAPILLGIGGSIAGLADIAASADRGAAKRRFLDDTAPLREKLAAEHRRTVEQQALLRLGGELLQLWNDRTRPAAVRRELLFQRWDDAVEILVGDGASAEEIARGKSGERARRQIEAFVRRHLPSGSINAYRTSELTSMNARRRSRAPFDPYSVIETTREPETAGQPPVVDRPAPSTRP